jgi:enoyl-CoA hydratase
MINSTQQSGIAYLELEYGKANALDLELCDALVAALDECREAGTRAVVLTARGKIFCAGVDLYRLINGGAAYVERFLPALSRALETLFFFPKPVIAAVNGHAIAGGCILACAADQRIMARDSGRVGIPELPVGVPFPTIALEIVRFAAAPQHVPTLLYGGATFPPQEALERGLLDALVAPERLRETATGLAESLAARAPAIFALTKEQLRAPVARRLRADGARFDEEVRRIWGAPETIEAIRGYVERTIAKSR